MFIVFINNILNIFFLNQNLINIPYFVEDIWEFYYMHIYFIIYIFYNHKTILFYSRFLIIEKDLKIVIIELIVNIVFYLYYLFIYYYSFEINFNII